MTTTSYYKCLRFACLDTCVNLYTLVNQRVRYDSNTVNN